MINALYQFYTPSAVRRGVVFGCFFIFALALLASLDSIQELIQKQQHVDALNERKKSLSARLVGTTNNGSDMKVVSAAFFDDATLRLAAARFQKEASSVLSDNSASLISVQVNSLDETGSDVIRLSLEFEIDQSHLHKLIYSLETHRPLISIESMNIKIRNEYDAPQIDRLFAIGIVLSSTWKARPL